jgi:hypothetical protein
MKKPIKKQAAKKTTKTAAKTAKKTFKQAARKTLEKVVAKTKRPRQAAGRVERKAKSALAEIRGGVEGAVHSVEQAAQKIVKTVKHALTGK